MTRASQLRAACIAALAAVSATVFAQPPRPPADVPRPPVDAPEPPADRAATEGRTAPAEAAPGSGQEPTRRGREPDIAVDEVLARFSEQLGKEFIVDPRMPSRLAGRGTIEGVPSYDAFLTILANNGFVAVEVDDYVNIVPDFGARQLPTRLVQTDDASIPDQEVVTRVLRVPPGEINANMLVPILRPLSPQYAHMAAFHEPDGQGGVLIIVDRYANVKRLTAVVQEILTGTGRRDGAEARR